MGRDKVQGAESDLVFPCLSYILLGLHNLKKLGTKAKFQGADTPQPERLTLISAIK